jgi:hypothetical protein
MPLMLHISGGGAALMLLVMLRCLSARSSDC